MLGLGIQKFWDMQPKLPFRFKAEFYTGNETVDKILSIAVTNITLPKIEGQISDGSMFLGNSNYIIPVWNLSSRKMDITFEETDDMLISKYIDNYLLNSFGRMPYKNTIVIHEFDKLMADYKSTCYICHICGYSEPEFKRDGNAGQLSITINYIIDSAIENWDGNESDIIFGSTDADDSYSDLFNDETDILVEAMIPIKSNNSKSQGAATGGAVSPPGNNTKSSKPYEYKTSDIGNGVKMIDITKSNKDKTGFNEEGVANKDNTKTEELVLVIHKVGFNSGGKYSGNGAAKGFHNDGVAAFTSGDDVYLSADRLLENHSAAGGSGVEKNGFAIELGDETKIGNAGAVVNVDGKWYANLDSGKGAQWVEMTEKDLNDFAKAVGVSNINDAFTAADSSDVGYNKIRTKQQTANGFGKNAKLKEVDFSNAQVLIPKLTKKQEINVEKILNAAKQQAEQQGKQIKVTNVKHHGNTTGYKDVKLEGNKKQDEQIKAMADKIFK